MIIIRHIDFFEVEHDPARIFSMLDAPSSGLEDYKYGTVEFKTEIINGLLFRRPDGSKIRVGYSKQAEEVLGIGYEAFKNQNNLISDLSDEVINKNISINNLNADIKAIKDKINNQTFWQRLKSVFKPERI